MAFISAAIVAGLGITSAIGTAIVSGLVGIAISFGASALVQKYTGREKKRNYAAVSGEVTLGGGVDMLGGFGITAIGGHREYYAKIRSGNKLNIDIFTLVNGWCDGLESYVWINGEKKSLISKAIIGGEAAHYDITGFEGLFSIRFYDGRPGQIADAKAVADTVGIGNNWKSTSRGTNICYVVVERLYNSVFKGRKPVIQWVLRGLRCYDLRKDSTFPGGSGTHRLNDPSTWEFSQNPAIQRLNYQLGFKGVLSGVSLIGMGRQLSQLDTNSYIAAANVCDTLRNVGGEDIPTYHCNIIAHSGDDHSQILKEFDDAMAGYGLNRAGLAGILAGAPQIPVREITADDIRIGAPKSSQFRRSAFDQVNYLAGQFISPESGFQPESLEPVTSASDVSNDGRIRSKTNDFLQVTDARIAQYLLTIRYRQNRLGARTTIPVSTRMWFISETGEWVTYEGKTWLITDKKAGNLTLAETSATIYNEGGIEVGPVITPPTAPINPSLLTQVQNFSAGSGIVEGSDGDQTPALIWTWDAPGDPSIVSIQIEYQREGSSKIYTVTTSDVESGSFTTTANVISNATYKCRAIFYTQPDRIRSYTPYYTTAVKTVDATVFLKQLQEDVVEVVSNFQANFDNINAYTALDGAQTSIIEMGSTFLQRKSIQKTAGTSLARIVNEEQVRATADSALAVAVTAVQASVGDLAASGLIKFESVVDEGGASASISMQVRVSTALDFEESGMTISVYETAQGSGVYTSLVVILADKFVISNGVDDLPPFVFLDNEMVLNGVIRSADNKRRIDPTGETFIYLET
ncbi:MAG: phage tail protein [Hyphomicrobiales bacterium]|nr:MAG: phage tail protein [Hyphomicrobiales bacterium]